VQRSWAENSENPLLYTEEFLRSAFDYPGTSCKMAPTIYRDSEPIAFIAGFPRRVSVDGSELNLVLNTLLTAAPELKGKGYGLALWGEFVKRARKEGFDGTIGFCVEGEEMNASILGCSRAFGCATQRIFSIPYLARLIRPAVDVSSSDEVEIFLEAAAAIVPETALARLWTRDEAEWQCHRRFGSVCVAHVSGRRRGVLTGCIMQIADEGRTNCLIVEDVLWGALDSAERGELLKNFLQRAGAAGARMAVVPQMGYADMEPFTKSDGGFRRSRRLMHAYLTVWRGAWPLAAPPNSVYIDVL
jgi:hypothetical protein